MRRSSTSAPARNGHTGQSRTSPTKSLHTPSAQCGAVVIDFAGAVPRGTYGRALGAERVPLESLGLHKRDLGKPVGALSAGQQRRLALALLVADPPHLLLLDEPTNHLSPTLCDELEDALGPGPGAIDRWLRRRRQGARPDLAG